LDWHRSLRLTQPCSRAREMPKSSLLPGQPRKRPPRTNSHSAGTRVPCYTITADNDRALRAGKLVLPPGVPWFWGATQAGTPTTSLHCVNHPRNGGGPSGESPLRALRRVGTALTPGNRSQERADVPSDTFVGRQVISRPREFIRNVGKSTLLSCLAGMDKPRRRHRAHRRAADESPHRA
jgi:hypothetical protein